MYSENQHLLTKMPLLCINKPAIASVSSEEFEVNRVELSMNTAVQPSEINGVAVF